MECNMNLKDFLTSVPFPLRFGQHFYTTYYDFVVENMKTYVGWKNDAETLYFIKDSDKAATMLATIMKRMKWEELPVLEMYDQA